ncbi:MAG: hypothetical protein WC842_03230 [Candidatus Paceibacterota bacterium]|jgi:hypothetical protein
MFNFLKKKDGDAAQTKGDGDGLSALSKFGINKNMMVTALKQMRNLNPAQKLQVKMMFKKQIKRDISKEEIMKGAEELGKQLKNEFSQTEIEMMKKDLIDLFGN